MSAPATVPVRLPRDARRLVRSWWDIRRGDAGWVPPLVSERVSFLDPRKNPYFAAADVQGFLALRGNEVVGTIMASLDHDYGRRDPRTGFFGFFETADDVETAAALLRAAEVWLRERGARRALGPFSFNVNHEFGLLEEGFETPPTIGNAYSPPYAPRLYAALGLSKVMEWYAYEFAGGTAVPDVLRRLADRVLGGTARVRLRTFDPRRWNDEVRIVHTIYTEAWEDHFAQVRFAPDEFRWTAERFRGLVDPRLCFFVEVDGEPAAVSITLPDVNPLLRRMNGRLFPLGWLHYVRGRRRVRKYRTTLLGVRPAYQHLRLGLPLYLRTWEEALARGVSAVEASLVLAENRAMRSVLERLGARRTKTYGTYERRWA